MEKALTQGLRMYQRMLHQIFRARYLLSAFSCQQPRAGRNLGECSYWGL